MTKTLAFGCAPLLEAVEHELRSHLSSLCSAALKTYSQFDAKTTPQDFVNDLFDGDDNAISEDSSTRLSAELVASDVVAPLATMRTFMAAFFQSLHLIDEGRLAEALEPALLASMLLGQLAPEISLTNRQEVHRMGQKIATDALYGRLRERACELAVEGAPWKSLKKAVEAIAQQLKAGRDELDGQRFLADQPIKSIERYLVEGLPGDVYERLFPVSARALERQRNRLQQAQVERAYVVYRLNKLGGAAKPETT